MKTKLFYLIALLLFVQISNAQRFGIKGGVNFANIDFSGGGLTISGESLTGFHIGPVAEINLADNLYFNTGLLYSLKGTKLDLEFEGEGVKATDKIHYLEIPLNAAYKFPINDAANIFVQAGPYLAYGLSGKEKAEADGVEEEGDLFEGDDAMKRFDWGLGFGGGVEFGSIVASINYQLGLANLSDESSAEAKMKVFQISLAYMFGDAK